METNNKIIEITLLDKLVIPSIYKTEGSFEEIVITKDLRKKLDITQEELIKTGLKSTPDGKGYTFNKVGEDYKLSVEFTELEFRTIKDGLVKLHDDKKLTEAHIDLYRKFVN